MMASVAIFLTVNVLSNRGCRMDQIYLRFLIELLLNGSRNKTTKKSRENYLRVDCSLTYSMKRRNASESDSDNSLPELAFRSRNWELDLAVIFRDATSSAFGTPLFIISEIHHGCRMQAFLQV
jgi:hypothetical protein